MNELEPISPPATKKRVDSRTSAQKTALPGRRGNLVWMKESDLFLVEDKHHFLYDERLEKPITEEFLQSIDEHGIRQPVFVAKLEIGGVQRTAIVAGRRRLRGVRAVNERRRTLRSSPDTLGSEDLEIPAILVKGTPQELVAIMLIENELREDDSPLVKAHKVQKYLGMIEELDDVEYSLGARTKAAGIFGVTVKTIDARLKLLTTTPEVQKAVEGGMSWWAASELADLPPEVQVEKLEELQTQAQETGKKTSVEAAKRVAGKGDSKKREKVQEALEALKEAALALGAANASGDTGVLKLRKALDAAATEYFKATEKNKK